MSLALGLMSGTSADGVSLALCSFKNKKARVLSHKNYPYPKSLSHKLIHAAELKTPQLSELNFELGKIFAGRCAQFLKSKKGRVSVIGSHGHTVFHQGHGENAHTLQIGEPSFIAEKTGIPVVSDFRPRDIAAGGEGAPLIPFFDDYFFGSGKLCAFQNIGGIANVTLAGGGRKPVAFDNGPGNCLIDLAMSKLTRGKFSYDPNGRYAAKGYIDLRSLRKMAAHPYFKKHPPKSTGRELFNEKFIPESLWKKSPETVLATLTYFTAYAIFESYKRFLKMPSQILVSGGGAKNKTLMYDLEILFHPVPVKTIEEKGIPVQAKEPAAFAFFALQALKNQINHAPDGTGARRACILGKITPGKV